MNCSKDKCKKRSRNKIKLTVDIHGSKVELTGNFCDDHFVDAVKSDFVPVLDTVVKKGE